MSSLQLPICEGSTFKAHFETELFAAKKISTLQINIGYVCNLACNHCHVESSPARTDDKDNMNREIAGKVIDWVLSQPFIKTVDFTGGSPEMNPNFKPMVEAFRNQGLHVIDRCNPTIIEFIDKKTGVDYAWVPEFLAKYQVEVVASLPCYTEENVDLQRGRGAYNDSVEGLLKLNKVGYGVDELLRLNLVYNPVGPHLPPSQDELEADYKRELKSRFGLVFNELWTITNMPIKRWRHQLERDGQLQLYMSLLVDSFNQATIEGLMCRHQISIDPQGRVYDCDFNQALSMHAVGMENALIWDLSADDLASRVIATDDHCYGCTAGSGSSCGGSIV